ncbi:hypothetical protein K438DRAFT_1952335 [Mycena galopus ATCC 62051]|nr:hypothetical protein K438DRAFT_1952335 [Mycena galopus ATCC 62051]
MPTAPAHLPTYRPTDRTIPHTHRMVYHIRNAWCIATALHARDVVPVPRCATLAPCVRRYASLRLVAPAVPRRGVRRCVRSAPAWRHGDGAVRVASRRVVAVVPASLLGFSLRVISLACSHMLHLSLIQTQSFPSLLVYNPPSPILDYPAS